MEVKEISFVKYQRSKYSMKKDILKKVIILSRRRGLRIIKVLKINKLFYFYKKFNIW